MSGVEGYGRPRAAHSEALTWATAQGDRLTMAVARLQDRARTEGIAGRDASRLELGLAMLRAGGLPIDEAFGAAERVGEIRYRLHPLDVGWDLRGERAEVEIDVGVPILRVSYARRRDGERRVLSGRPEQVVALLQREGYLVRVVGTPPAHQPLEVVPIIGLDGVWIRMVDVDGAQVLEMRDPNSGQGGGPAAVARHQYRVVAGVLQRRVMPPEAVGDLWADIGAPQWEPYPLPPSAMPDGPVRDYYEWVTR